MPRDYRLEHGRDREKYKQLLFKVKVDEAEKHRAHLAKHNIKPVEWLRYAMSLELVPGAAANEEAIMCKNYSALPAGVSDISDMSIVDHVVRSLSLAVANTDISGMSIADHVMRSLDMPDTVTDINISDVDIRAAMTDLPDVDISAVDADISVKCARCGFAGAGYVNGYFRCTDCEFLNYEPESDVDIDDDASAGVEPGMRAVPRLCNLPPGGISGIVDIAHSEVDVAVYETPLVVNSGDGQPKKRKPTMPSPALETVAEWCKLHKEGMGFAQIAKISGGYEASTIRKRVRKYDSDNISQ